MSTWTIKCSAGAVTTYTEFADLDLTNLQRVLMSQAADVVTFEVPGNAYADTLFPNRSTIWIRKDDVQWFVGTVRLPERGAEPSAERITYEVFGPWYWLRASYQQQWYIYVPGYAYLLQRWKTRVILCQDTDGSRLTTDEQIEDALQQAIDAYVAMAGPGTEPFQIGDIDPDLDVPFEECTDITCEEVILKMLRYMPDVVCWFDYSTSPPTFHVKNDGNAPTETLALGTAASTVEAVSPIKPRYDLQIPGVTVIYETRTYVSGLAAGDYVYETITTETSGTTTDVEAVILTIQLAGHRQYVHQKIVTSAWPTSGAPPAEDLNDKTWWKAMLPELAGVQDADLTITDGARTSALARILAQGTVQEWMTDGAGNAIQAEDCTVTAKGNWVERDSNGDITAEKKEQDLTLRLTATDAETKTYRKFEYADLAEPACSSLASNLHAAWSRLHYEGQIRLVDSECDSGLHPGHRLNVTGGATEWATMGALIQRIVEHVDTGVTVLSFGPPLTYRPDRRALLRKIRNRRVPKNHRVRLTGKAKDDGNGGNEGGKVPQYDGGYVDGVHTSQYVNKYNASTGALEVSLELNPSDAGWIEHKIATMQDVGGGVLKLKPGWLKAHS